MHLTSFVTALMLSLSVSAAPTELTKGEIVTRSGTNGSIYSFESASNCHGILRKYGSCGISTYHPEIGEQNSFVAMPYNEFDKYGQAQNNKLCGKTIVMKHNGVTKTATVADRNVSDDHSIDMCLDLWEAFGGHNGDGTVIRNFSWSIQL
ncbi:uncharacterized protein TrAtP1_013207 [Trichoderma atroviride]|uniref:Uncharacterized protein n=1 Tax=Hypocrea atroviridis (strain ATCC 20476 / IMI 206040) TaxID=452589 RepID=G9NTQ8_HYPAI|nr:uncharacterized protein TRIATDRAFT_88525 [Trichoderma atroviride IMI 206040]EHK46097.1 hypothetical protein TRIATDRAFT_88525 [Trichoderma atroviride IMI 206040]UKZ72265.1 hypothetical protein TrAtP1_013207 [Trichoderma atroviride]